MSEEKKKDPRDAELRRETFFLPPLKMFLSFFDKESKKGKKEHKDAVEQEAAVGKNVEKLIEKLSEKEE